MIKAVIERAMYGYGRQVQEYRQKLKQSQSRNYAQSFKPSISNFNSLTPLITAIPTHTMSLPNTMEPSISAPNYTLDKLSIHGTILWISSYSSYLYFYCLRTTDALHYKL